MPTHFPETLVISCASCPAEGTDACTDCIVTALHASPRPATRGAAPAAVLAFPRRSG